MGELLCKMDLNSDEWNGIKTYVKNLDFSNDAKKLTEVFSLVQQKFSGILSPS